MKLAQFLHMKRWNSAIFGREYGISISLLRKIINEKGNWGVSLDLALYLNRVTQGAVTPWDLCPNADAIKTTAWQDLNKKRKRSKKKTNDDNNIDPVNTD
jgi:hypothetical protein